MNNLVRPKKIMLVGGGTGGSVTPLLAVAEELLQENTRLDAAWELVFVGTSYGPEREMVRHFNQEVGPLRFLSISSGKLRRYFSLANIFDIFKIFLGFFMSVYVLIQERPAAIVSAGSFVAVPLIWAAACLRCPVLVHQADVRPGLANRLSLPWAKRVTVAFSQAQAAFPQAVWTGNPMRHPANSWSASDWRKKYGLQLDKPLVLVTGGGTGANAINSLIAQALPGLLKDCQLVHVTGRGKRLEIKEQTPNYHAFEFLPHPDLLGLMAASDLIVSRCGLSFLTELSYLKKAAILIPMPDSHQEDNAAVYEAQQAAIILSQTDLTPEKLAAEIRASLGDHERRRRLGEAAGKVMKAGGAAAVAELVKQLAI